MDFPHGFSHVGGFFACVLSACLLCPWNFLFGAFTAVWIGVAVGSVLEEVMDGGWMEMRWLF
jgi:hypothetical protein